MTNHSASNAAQAGARQAIELEQFEAELRPKRPIDLSRAHLRLGIDVGSTTVKLAVIDDNDNYLGFLSRANTFSAYRRFISDTSEE